VRLAAAGPVAECRCTGRPPHSRCHLSRESVPPLHWVVPVLVEQPRGCHLSREPVSPLHGMVSVLETPARGWMYHLQTAHLYPFCLPRRSRKALARPLTIINFLVVYSRPGEVLAQSFAGNLLRRWHMFCTLLVGTLPSSRPAAMLHGCRITLQTHVQPAATVRSARAQGARWHVGHVSQATQHGTGVNQDRVCESGPCL